MKNFIMIHYLLFNFNLTRMEMNLWFTKQYLIWFKCLIQKLTWYILKIIIFKKLIFGVTHHDYNVIILEYHIYLIF